MRRQVASLPRALGAGFLFALAMASQAAEPGAGRVDQLVEQNRLLQEQVRAQQKAIDEINARMADVLRANERHEREWREWQDRAEGPGATTPSAGAVTARDHAVRVGAEMGMAFFHTGREGQFPVGEFRVDDPVLSLEAPAAKNVYFFAELKLMPRESSEEKFQLGEMYVDFEDVLANWDRPGLLNVRAGRVNIPFGEEYLVRTPTVNALISHSLSDTWGCDEGAEIYGRIGPAQYVVAVQNGGSSRLHDFTSDKSVTARVGWKPARWLHVSASAMRTGKLATVADNISELWFGNGFFRAIGPAATTPTFWANLFELDATARWRGGQLSAAIGQVRYDDSDSSADNARRMHYGFVEAAQEISGPLYAAARYSAIRAPGGYPLAGWGPLGKYFFRPGVLTSGLTRASLGLGYRFGPPLVLKMEYTWEAGRMTTGAPRDHGNFFGTELGVKF